MYVSKLFAIAKLVGLRQQDIIRHLGLASHVPTTLWAQGKRSMPDKHLSALRALLERACDEHATHLPPEQAQAFDAQVTQLLCDWVVEVDEARNTGPSAALYKNVQRLILLYDGMDSRSFMTQLAKDEHRQPLYDIAIALKQDLETLDRVCPVEIAKAEQFVEEFRPGTPRLRPEQFVEEFRPGTPRLRPALLGNADL
jgi:hypothetical protein